jgi:DNA repair exonuclease SbcCD ATPase subunit
MSTTEPQPAATPAATPSPRRRRNPWIWISAALLIVSAGLLVWALVLDSDLEDTQADVTALRAQVEESEQSGSTAAAALQAGFNALAQQVGVTQADVEATQQEIQDAEQTVAQAQEDARAAAERASASAADAAERAKARVDEAQAQVEEAEARTQIAADCGKAYLSALGSLFSGDSVREQVAAVRDQLQGISANCQAALAGS